METLWHPGQLVSLLHYPNLIISYCRNYGYGGKVILFSVQKILCIWGLFSYILNHHSFYNFSFLSFHHWFCFLVQSFFMISLVLSAMDPHLSWNVRSKPRHSIPSNFFFFTLERGRLIYQWDLVSDLTVVLLDCAKSSILTVPAKYLFLIKRA